MPGLCSVDEFTLSLAYIKLRMRMKDIIYINNQTLKQNRLIADQDCLLPSAYDSRCSFYIENIVLKSYLKCPSLTLEKDRFGTKSNSIFLTSNILSHQLF